MGKKVGLLLSGCGVMDGAEIHEAVCTMLALDRAGAEIVCLAPDKEQDVVNHLSNSPEEGKRNVLIEAARIARGNIKDVKSVSAADLDAIILPGGFGAAKNLSTFATEGAECKIDADVEKLLRDMHQAGKPIGALCIAPAVVARIFGADLHPELTIGTDEGTGKALETMGAKHVSTPVTGIVVDRKNKIVTTPCYMLAENISQVADGAEKAVKAVLEMA